VDQYSQCAVPAATSPWSCLWYGLAVDFVINDMSMRQRAAYVRAAGVQAPVVVFRVGAAPVEGIFAAAPPFGAMTPRSAGGNDP
jgi:hypothetical protein